MITFLFNRLLNFLFFFGAIFFVSCRTTEEIANRSSAEEIISAIQQQSPSISTMNAEGILTVENEEHSFNLSFELQYKNNDSLLLTLFGPFGISAGILQLTRDSFQLYNAIENRLIIASVHDKALETLLHFSADFPTILKLFFDENLSGTQPNIVTLSTTQDEITLSLVHNNSTEKFWFNNNEQAIVRFEKFNSANEILLKKTMKRFSSIKEKRFPNWIRTYFPQEHRTITISYNSLELNNTVQCSFTVPRNTEIIRR